MHCSTRKRCAVADLPRNGSDGGPAQPQQVGGQCQAPNWSGMRSVVRRPVSVNLLANTARETSHGCSEIRDRPGMLGIVVDQLQRRADHRVVFGVPPGRGVLVAGRTRCAAQRSNSKSSSRVEIRLLGRDLRGPPRRPADSTSGVSHSSARSTSHRGQHIEQAGCLPRCGPS